jgi:hypothetical protein
MTEQTSLAVENLSQTSTVCGFVGGRDALGATISILPPGPGLWGAGLSRQTTILKDREARIDRIALVAAPKASSGTAWLAPTGHILTHQFHPTARRCKFARQNIHECGFTSAIGANDCMDTAPGNLE